MNIDGDMTESNACLFNQHFTTLTSSQSDTMSSSTVDYGSIPGKTSKCTTTNGSMKSTQKSQNNEMTAVLDNENSNPENTLGDIFSLFPFICGLCFEKFNKISTYYSHFSLHEENIEQYFHSCKTESSTCYESEIDDVRRIKVDIYSCGTCSFVTPSMCLLHEHLVLVECMQRYEIDVHDKMAYATADTSNKIYSTSLKIERKKQVKRKKSSRNSYADKHKSKRKKKHKPTKDESDIKEEHTDNIADEDKREQEEAEDVSVFENWLEEKINAYGDNQNEKDGTARYSVNMHIDSEGGTVNEANDDDISDTEVSPSHLIEENELSKRKPKQKNREKISKKQKLGQTDKILDVLKRHLMIETEPLGADLEKSVLKKKLMTDEAGNPVYANDTFIPCEKCGAIVQRSKITVHMISHRETRDFPCDQCPYQSKSSFALKQHSKMVHTTENNFICQTCGKSFKNNLYLKQHTNTHSERDKQCELCPQSFTTIALLRRHMFVHKDEKQYTCDQCERQFTFKGNLNSHMRTVHSDQRNFECSQCGKLFKILHALKKHEKTHLPHQHFCLVCGKSFVTAFNMKIHMKVHDK